MSLADPSDRDGFPGSFIRAAQSGRRNIVVEDKKPDPEADEAWMDIMDLYAQDDHWLKLDLHVFCTDIQEEHAVINYIGNDHQEGAWIKCNADAVMEVTP